MKNLLYSAFVACSMTLSVALFALCPSPARALTSPEIGSPAPQFTLTDTAGKQHALKDYAGKIVVVEWFNEGCPFVKKHYVGGNMQSLQERYTKQGIVWLSVVSSAPGKQGSLSAEGHNETRKKWNISAAPLLLDEAGSVGKSYGAKTTPHMFIIDAQGKLVYRGAIDSTSSTDADDIPTSKNYVAAALDEILAGKPVSTSSTEPYGCSVKYAS
jgi:peroxiredoxin